MIRDSVFFFQFIVHDLIEETLQSFSLIKKKQPLQTYLAFHDKNTQFSASCGR